MAKRANSEGKISTFFSYKGGVGRTMAVANVGFIAAMAGRRVLLMDWDLEAPGLPVYFRGVTPHQAASKIRKAPGILNLVTDWCDSLRGASDRQEAEVIFKKYLAGLPFIECASPLLPSSRLPKGAKLDIIGAGSKIVGTVEPLPYAETLSRFDWAHFFSDYVGGHLVSALRRWAKQNYDLILIDSRTGLADVAGICTMQMPDEVVLCFVLNRQNTEGVAEIAESILASRGDDIAIRLAPMRISKDRPAEEADARSRAQREFRHAGLEQLSIEHDMGKLAIAASPTMPFYEALAPFVATSATADQLTFEYLRLAQELTGALFEAPRLDEKWVEEVRRRLQPRMTTVEYLATLETADPDRAFDELDRFLDGALDADPNRELEPEYVRALVRSGLEAVAWRYEESRLKPGRALAEKAVRLLEQLNEVSDGDWRLALVDALDEFDTFWSRATGSELVEKYGHRDEILAAGEQSAEILTTRARIRVSIAIEERLGKNFQASEDALKSAEELLDQIAGAHAEDAEERLLARAQIFAERARLYEIESSRGDATTEWQRVIKLAPDPESRTARSLIADAYLGLANANPGNSAAAGHVIAAARTWRLSVVRDVGTFASACKAIFESKDVGTQSIAFSLALFDTKLPANIGMARLGGPKDALEYSVLLQFLVTSMDPKAARFQRAVDAVGQAAEQQVARIRRIKFPRSGAARIEQFASAYAGLCDTLVSTGASDRVVAALKKQIDLLQPIQPSS